MQVMLKLVRSRPFGLRAAALIALLAQAAAGPARADDEFYKGKTVNLIIATATGGGYDTYGRLVARHMGKHLAGQPTVIVQNMPGAVGVRAANYLYNVAPKDGTAIAMLDQAIYLDQILGSSGLNADASKFNWVGRILSNSAVLYAWHAAKVKTIEDAFTHELVVAVQGAASKLNWTMLNNTVGTKLKLVAGYPGSNESRLALMRGEVEGLSQPWPVIKLEAEQMLRDKQINLIVQTGAVGHPELMQVPRMVDLAKTDEDRVLLALFSSPSTIGRALAAPPGVAAERIAVLREAFMATMHDPALIEEARRVKLELDPLDGAALQASIAGTGAVSPALVARARRVAER
jgi:tripartite-type tricarboxylate transporter receptor subunit TctC